MKSKSHIAFNLVACLFLTGCVNNDITKERIITKDVLSAESDSSPVNKVGTINLLFKANQTIPYISLKEGEQYISEIRKTILGKDKYITLKQEADKATFTTTEGVTCVLDKTNQTISYSDFDAFINHMAPMENTITLLTPDKTSPVKLIDKKYTKGSSYSIDLKNYSLIDIYTKDNDFYLPLVTFNDLFISTYSAMELAYNFNEVYFISANSKFTVKDEDDEDVYTPLGQAFYKGRETNPTVSKEYAEFNYQNICMNFDYLYGVKGVGEARTYTSFDAFLTSKGYKKDLLSGDVHKMDNAYAYALSMLKDNHTVQEANSPLYQYGTSTIDKTKYDQTAIKQQEECEVLNAARAHFKSPLGFKVDRTNGIAYIAFNDFDDVNPTLLKKDKWSEQEILSNSPLLFKYAYQQIADDSSITHVAVDLATNNGGSSEGLVYMLGILLGQVEINTFDQFTSAAGKAIYKVDINLDGVVDDKDTSLREHGKTIAFINTVHAFSCGNALPVLAKNNYPNNVINIGQTTGGGTCVLRESFTALGSKYALSGLQTLGKRDNDGKIVNIEDGAAPDIALSDVRSTLDRDIISTKLLEYTFSQKE